MDYGKMAYLKQEELENRLSLATNTPSKRSVFLNCKRKSQKRLKLFDVFSSCFVVNLSFDSGVEGAKISLYASDVLLSSLTYSKNLTFTVSLDEPSVRSLYVVSNGDFFLIKAEILVLNGSVDEPLSSSALDKLGEKIGFVACHDGHIKLHIFDYGAQMDEDFLTIGFGDIVDISACVYEGIDCFCVAFRDFCANVFLVFALKEAENYRVVGSKFIASGADSVSISNSLGNLLVGYTRQKTAYIESVFGSDWLSSEGCDTIYLLKNAATPIAIFSQNGINTLRVCLDELSSTYRLCAKAVALVG